jgi:hypothetical protein
MKEISIFGGGYGNRDSSGRFLPSRCYCFLAFVKYNGMKKSMMLAILLAICFNAFAQAKVSITGHLATDFSAVAPTVGLEFNFNRIDVLTAANFWVYSSDRIHKNYQYYTTDNNLSESRFEFFAGVAPKAVITEKWSLTFPILAKVHFRTDALEYENSAVYSSDSPKNVEYFGFGFDIGSRTYYALSQQWNIYAGFLFGIFSKQNQKRTYWKESANDTYTMEYDTTVLFDYGELELGVRYTF